MKCTRCGQELPDGLNFCPFCGADMTLAAPAADDPEDVPDQGEHVCVDREVPAASDAGTGEPVAFDPYAYGRRRSESVFAGPAQEGGARVEAPQGPTINVMVPPEEAMLPPEYKPITMWGYVGYSLLFSIPLVGFILAIVYSFGGTQNVNLRNYARSYFVMFLIAVGISIILGIIVAVTGIAYRYL